MKFWTIIIVGLVLFGISACLLEPYGDKAKSRRNVALSGFLFLPPPGVVNPAANNPDSEGNEIPTVPVLPGGVSGPCPVGAIENLNAGYFGVPGVSGYLDGMNPLLNHPADVLLVNDLIYIADRDNHLIRVLVPATGQISTLAGEAGVAGGKDGIGSGALFNYPTSLACRIRNGITYLFVNDTGGHTVREINLSTSQVETISGAMGEPGADNGGEQVSRLHGPRGLAMCADEFLAVADTQNAILRSVNPKTRMTGDLAGTHPFTGQIDCNDLSLTTFLAPVRLSCVDSDLLYVIDEQGRRLRRIDLEQDQSTTVVSDLDTPRGLNIHENEFYVSSGNQIVQITGFGSTTILVGSEDSGFDDTPGQYLFNQPEGLRVYGNTGNSILIVADSENHIVRLIAP